MEVFSEDPYLTTILGGAYTFSLQVDSHTWLNLSKRSTATICSQRLPNTSPFTPDPTARASPSSRTRRSLFLLVSFTQTRSLRILPSPIRNPSTMLKRTWNHASLFVFYYFIAVIQRSSIERVAQGRTRRCKPLFTTDVASKSLESVRYPRDGR